MTPQQFRTLLGQKTNIELLDPCLHDDSPPFVFEGHDGSWDAFRDELVDQLEIQRDNIRIVGSGRLGFSLRPGTNLKLFDDRSDIDVVIVDSDLFDQIWLALLRAVYPNHGMNQRIGGWLDSIRNQVYGGWIVPPQIKLDGKVFGARARTVIDLRTRWFNALKLAAQHPTKGHADIQGRIYRTWSHADLYHSDSLNSLRASLT